MHPSSRQSSRSKTTHKAVAQALNGSKGGRSGSRVLPGEACITISDFLLAASLAVLDLSFRMLEIMTLNYDPFLIWKV
jgi:hypothetical protein